MSQSKSAKAPSAPVFILRLQTSAGMKRLLFESDQKTWKDVVLQIKDSLRINPSEFEVSRSSLVRPEFIDKEEKGLKVTIKALGLKHGDLLYLYEDGSTSQRLENARPKTARPMEVDQGAETKHKLTKDCQHGPQGRCLHCNAAPLGTAKTSDPTARCTHGSNATCIHCSIYVREGTKESAPAVWLCNHPENVFCNKCLPPSSDGKTVQLACDCDASRGQRFVKFL
jgi:hypothetical protein